jgi:nucleoside-triphosphatase THEP1
VAADDIAQAAARIASNPNANWILTGPTNSGKSHFLERLLDRLSIEFPNWKIGGLLSRGVFLNNAKIAYQGIDCLSGQPFPLTIKRDLPEEAQHFLELNFDTPPSPVQGQQVGSWLLLDEGLTQATAAIHAAITARCNLVVIDEFGPLEIQGKALRPAADELLQAGLPALLVVREKLLEEVLSLYPYCNFTPLQKSEPVDFL